MATAMPPAIPPRPTRSQNKGSNEGRAPPKVPPRPTRHLERKVVSPDDRFAPSPLNEGFPKQPGPNLGPDEVDKFSSEPREAPNHPGSVTMPSLGEEGSEYAAVAEELSEPEHPEQTRTVGGDMKLHAPKPSLPVESAKQRVAAIAHIDSDKAASFAIDKSTGDESPSVPPRKKSATSFLSSEADRDIDEEQGIPEIGQRVPMDPSSGDVQAPSPAPNTLSPEKSGKHARRGSAQSGDHYGFHGHVTDDKLEKAYYEKHPEEYQKQMSRPYNDRQTDYSLSKNELNEIIRETAEHGSGLGTSNHEGTPSEEAGYRAHEEFASRLASPRTAAGATKPGLREEVSPANLREPEEGQEAQDENTIHVEEPRAYMDEPPADEHDRAPILAEDEVAKHPPPFERHAAVEPSGTPIDREGTTSRPTSQHSSRPTSAALKSPSNPEFEVTRLEDVKEYEPLFKDEGTKVEPPASPATGRTSVPPRFPSKDVWEDAPNSAYETTEVNTPDAGEAKPKRGGLPERYVPTPAHAFAKHQEELAEKESERLKGFVPRGEGKPASWMPPELAAPPEEPDKKVPAQRRFPSRDVWEDAPESHLHKTTVSSRQTPESPVETPEVPLRPVRSAEKPPVPSRPRPKKAPSDETRPKPVVSDKPKPVIPARPARNAVRSPEAKEIKEVKGVKETPAPAPKPKPAIPSKPVGGKIAALQAGFMSDLNKRLQLGPHAPPKKEEPRVEDQEGGEEKEEVKEVVKKPLSDARKGRARGPQRRAPARSTAPPAAAAPAVVAATPAKIEGLSLSVSKTHVVWSVDPEDGEVLVSGEAEVTKTEVVEASPKVMEPEELPRPEIVTAAPKMESPEKSPEGKNPEGKSPEEKSPEEKSPEPKGPEAEISIDTSPVKSEPDVAKGESVEVEPLKEESLQETLPKEESPKKQLSQELPREDSLQEESPIEGSLNENSRSGGSLNRASSNGDSPIQESAKEESVKESSPGELRKVESPQEDASKDVAEVPVFEEPPSDDAKADISAVNPLETDIAEAKHLGELPAEAQGRSDQVSEGDVGTSPSKEA